MSSFDHVFTIMSSDKPQNLLSKVYPSSGRAAEKHHLYRYGQQAGKDKVEVVAGTGRGQH